MKKVMVLVSCVALAACAENAAPEEEVAEEAVVEEAAAPGPGDAGTFEVTYEDGSVGSLTTNEDGTFSFTLGEESGTGTISQSDDGTICFEPDADDQETNCWTTGEVAEDGSWTSTSTDGEVTVTVRGVAAAE